MRKKEFRRKWIEVWVEQFLRGGNVDFAVLDAKVVAMNQQRRSGQSRNA